MYLFLLMLIYLAFVSLGLPDSLLGSAWPVIHNAFDVPLSYAGIVTMIISLGTICSSLLSERLTKKLGVRIVTVASVFLTAIALYGFSTASAFRMLCLWAIPYGLGAGAIDAALNNYVALHYSSKHMSWLHCFWGLGTIISPYVMSYALTSSVWQNGYRMVALVQTVIAVILLITLPVWKVNRESEQQSAEEARVIGIRGVFRIRGVPQLLLGFFSYCALESTLILWASSYLVGAKGISTERAAAFASLFCIGITAGRFLAGFVTEKLGDYRLIQIGAGVLVSGVYRHAAPGPDRYPPAGRTGCDGHRLCACVPVHHPRDAVELRQGKLAGDHRNPDGERLLRLNLHASGIRTDRKPHICRADAGLRDAVCRAHVRDDPQDLPDDTVDRTLFTSLRCKPGLSFTERLRMLQELEAEK